ncbi:MAG TPA: helix-turn-helix transcriptional regulator [Candidatus Dormibacteraeota bacterium]|nr:helix-turn-helix transcriptional regulator [Candidatus Dormibacteraeota bacterium]
MTEPTTLKTLRLTRRQEQILALVASGLSDKEIGSRLGVSPRTIQSHLDRLFLQHGFHKRTAAVAAWLRNRPDSAQMVP